jgi:hypothetical protein
MVIVIKISANEYLSNKTKGHTFVGSKAWPYRNYTKRDNRNNKDKTNKQN